MDTPKSNTMRFLLFLLLIPVVGYNQNSITADFNRDGIMDTLEWEHSSGSSSSSLFLNIYDGASGRSVMIMMEHAFCDFLQVIGLNDLPGYDQQAWEMIFAKIMQFPEPKTHSASLDWLLSVYYSRGTLPDRLPLTDICRVSPHWISGPTTVPEVSIRYADSEMMARLREFYWVGGATDSKQGMVIYFGHNHYDQQDALFIRDSIRFGDGYILCGKHGLLYSRNGQYAWILMHDRPLFGGPGKLRWKSIYDVQVYQDLLLVYIQGPLAQRHRLLLLHPDSGTFATLAEAEGVSNFNYVITDHSLQLTSNGDLHTYDLATLHDLLLE